MSLTQMSKPSWARRRAIALPLDDDDDDDGVSKVAAA